MTITDEAKLFAIRTQLLEMRFKLDASIKIINYVFKREPDPSEVAGDLHHSNDTGFSDTLDGLYPGQLPNIKETECEEADSEIEECIE